MFISREYTSKSLCTFLAGPPVIITHRLYKTRVVAESSRRGGKTLGHMSGNPAGGALGLRPLNLKQQGVYPAKLPLEVKHV